MYSKLTFDLDFHYGPYWLIGCVTGHIKPHSQQRIYLDVDNVD